MIQEIEANKSSFLQERQQKIMMQELMSYDKDSKVGLSKAELNKYVFDKQMAGAEVPEFAQKLVERFNEIDQNKDGMVSGEEMVALSNNRGLWSVSPIAAQSLSVVHNPNAASGSVGLLQNNISGLVQKGIDYVKNNPQIVSKVQDMVQKII